MSSLKLKGFNHGRKKSSSYDSRRTPSRIVLTNFFAGAKIDPGINIQILQLFSLNNYLISLYLTLTCL